MLLLSQHVLLILQWTIMKFLLTLFPTFFINVKLLFFTLKTANDKSKKLAGKWSCHGSVSLHVARNLSTRKGFVWKFKKHKTKYAFQKNRNVPRHSCYVKLKWVTELIICTLISIFPNIFVIKPLQIIKYFSYLFQFLHGKIILNFSY